MLLGKFLFCDGQILYKQSSHLVTLAMQMCPPAHTRLIWLKCAITKIDCSLGIKTKFSYSSKFKSITSLNGWLANSVTRFDQNLPFWPSFQSLWLFFEDVTLNWAKFWTYLCKLLWPWTNFPCKYRRDNLVIWSFADDKVSNSHAT